MRHPYRRFFIIAAIVIAFLLLPWAFYAQIPDIIYPPSGDNLPIDTVVVPNFAPIPVTAPIELQYEGYPLSDVMSWLKGRVPDTAMTLPMLNTIDQVARDKNISMGLMLGIVNAEHSLLSYSAMAAGGWIQILQAPLNPFSYDWTDETHMGVSNVGDSAIGAASIISSVANAWSHSPGWGNSNSQGIGDQSAGFTDFLKGLSSYYRLGQFFVPAQANTWEQAVSDVGSSLGQYVYQNDQSGWESQIKTYIAQGYIVFGQKGAAAQQILDKTIQNSNGATIMDRVTAAVGIGWKYTQGVLENGYANVISGLQEVYGGVADANLSVATLGLFIGLVGLAAAVILGPEVLAGVVLTAVGDAAAGLMAGAVTAFGALTAILSNYGGAALAGT